VIELESGVSKRQKILSKPKQGKSWKVFLTQTHTHTEYSWSEFFGRTKLKLILNV